MGVGSAHGTASAFRGFAIAIILTIFAAGMYVLVIEALPEPSKSVVTLIVFASLRVGEVLGLRWNRVKGDRLVIVERIYDGVKYPL